MVGGETQLAEVLAGGSRGRKLVEDCLSAGELDGFLAAYFLGRYAHEDRRGDLSARLAELDGSHDFTRANVARLGIALERGWIARRPELVATFAAGCERLERQKPDQALDFRSSLKLLWGLSLGAQAPQVKPERPDLAARLGMVLSDFRTHAADRPRDYVLATAILSDLMPEQRDALGRDVVHYVLRLNPSDLGDANMLAVLWAARTGGFALEATSPAADELRTLHSQLLPYLFRLGEITDVLDALMADHLYNEVIRRFLGGGLHVGDALSVVLAVVDSFPELVRRLRERRHGRPNLIVENEYDVQDIVYVALKPHIPDLSDEEWTPKDAGTAKRIDFVSEGARLCLEAKKTRSIDHARAIPDELKIDIESYYVHKSCDVLVVFVYDPDGYVADARQMETQLSGHRAIRGRHLEVMVRIRPR